MRPPEELLYDSEASLRLVDHAIEELSSTAMKLGNLDRIQQMHGRLREVSAATEVATTSILDGLARTVDLVAQLDVAVALPDADRHRVLASVRGELGDVINHLQFQDITSQQLGHIASLLGDMHGRIDRIVTAFSQPCATFTAHDQLHGTFDPHATTAPAGDRQAVADEIFAIRTERKTA